MGLVGFRWGNQKRGPREIHVSSWLTFVTVRDEVHVMFLDFRRQDVLLIFRRQSW